MPASSLAWSASPSEPIMRRPADHGQKRDPSRARIERCASLLIGAGDRRRRLPPLSVRFDNNKYSVTASAVGPACGGPRLCRSDRAAAGRADRRAASSRLRRRPPSTTPSTMSLSWPQTRRAQECRALPGLSPAGGDRAGAPQAEVRTRWRPPDGSRCSARC
jgi:hypothetical protein